MVYSKFLKNSLFTKVYITLTKMSISEVSVLALTLVARWVIGAVSLAVAAVESCLTFIYVCNVCNSSARFTLVY